MRVRREFTEGVGREKDGIHCDPMLRLDSDPRREKRLKLDPSGCQTFENDSAVRKNLIGEAKHGHCSSSECLDRSQIQRSSRFSVGQGNPVIVLLLLSKKIG